MSRPLPTLAATLPGHETVPPCLSNGVIGISPGLDPLRRATTLVSGFVFSHPAYAVECLAPAPFPLGLELGVDGERLRDAGGRAQTTSQALSTANGELATGRAWSLSAGGVLRLEVVQFVSRSVPCVVCQQVTLTADRALEIEVLPVVDEETSPARRFTADTDAWTRGPYKDDAVDLCRGYETDRSRLGIAVIVERGQGLARRAPGAWTAAVAPGAPAVIRTIAALVTSAASPDPALEAVRMARWGAMAGFERLRRDNAAAWEELWQSRVVVTGSDEDQRGLDAAFFYYHSCVHSSMDNGIPPFGLAHHDKYYGHVFWDMDIWMLLPALVAAPAAARAMLEYRARGLPAARARARLFGYRGAHFPWEASADGSETTPSWCATGWAEQHVTPGVAIGAWEVQQACGDEVTLREHAWPVIRSVAEWIESRGRFTPRGFEVDLMMGPDEGVWNLSNQSYFNLLTRMAMRAAVSCAGLAGVTPPSAWSRIAERIVVPRDPATGIILPFDPEGTATIFNEAANRLEERPAAGLVGESAGTLQFLFLHGMPVDERSFFATWRVEEERRQAAVKAGRRRGVGFATGPFAACAAHFGDRQAAAELFRDAWEPYWIEPFGMTREVDTHAYGGFVTNNGSLLQTALFGFTGLRVENGIRPRHPAALPAGWERIEVGRLWSRGRPYRLTADHGRKARLAPLD